MFTSKKNLGILVLVLAIAFASGLMFFNTEAQISTRTRISTPGYYYVKPANVSQDMQTAAITLTERNVVGYMAGLQVVFKTEVANTNNANVTLKINNLDAEPLLTRHGQEFGILELDTGVIMTATYDGANFISDYVAARSLKGRLLATATVGPGTYSDLDGVTWTVASGVTAITTPAVLPDYPAGRLLGFPNTRLSQAQIGWFYEVSRSSNDETVTKLQLFGFQDDGVAQPVRLGDLSLNHWTSDPDRFDSLSIITTDMEWNLESDVTTTETYTIKLYTSEN